jgi:hypothetical protein
MPSLSKLPLVAKLPNLITDGPFRADGELWTKWTSNELELAPAQMVLTTKTRWLRKFDTTGSSAREIEVGPDEEPLHDPRPSAGCNVELTQIGIRRENVWTFGFEAFGGLTAVSQQLSAVASLLADRNPPSMGAVVLASYPAWLSDRLKSDESSSQAGP